MFGRTFKFYCPFCNKVHTETSGRTSYYIYKSKMYLELFCPSERKYCISEVSGPGESTTTDKDKTFELPDDFNDKAEVVSVCCF